MVCKIRETFPQDKLWYCRATLEIYHKTHFLQAYIAFMESITALAPFTHTASLSFSLSMNQSSMRNDNGFVSLMNQSLQNRVCVSGFAPLSVICIAFERAADIVAAFLRAYEDAACAKTSVHVPPPEFIWSSMQMSPSTALLLMNLILSSRFNHSGTIWMTWSFVVQNHILKIWFATFLTHLYSVFSLFFGSTAPMSLYVHKAHFPFSVLIQFLARLCPQEMKTVFIYKK